METPLKPSRPLSYDEAKAAEAAFQGWPCEDSWSDSAKAIYDGVLAAKLRRDEERRLEEAAMARRRYEAVALEEGSGPDAELAEVSAGDRRRVSALGWTIGWLALLVGLEASGSLAHAAVREQLVPILGTTVEQKPVGVVANVLLGFEQRSDRQGLAVHFKTVPGRFSQMSQTAVEQGIYRSAKAAGLSPDSWTVVLAVPYRGVTIYGDSLAAMVALAVLAMAKGEAIPPDRVMTGAVAPDGHIAPVGAVPLKVLAASDAHMRRVLVPDALDEADGDWITPFLMHVSPVSTIGQAYEALTGHPLR
jgi:hypothetical protein